ncbi:aldehyde dehydrogenase family protein, partial [Bacillus pumilus]
LVKSTKQIKLGNCFDEETKSEPLISAEHREKGEKYVSIGLDEGARLETGGKRPHTEELSNGFFYLPTIFSGCTSEMRIVKEEV